MNKFNTLKSLHDNYLVAVVRGKSKKQALDYIEQIIEGGILNIEVTFTTPQAEIVIQELKENYKDKEVVIGAGTVLDDVTARMAIMNGASYIVSPHFDVKIAEMCNLYNTPYLPGCGSVTEITQALKAGVDVVKLFPGDLLGAKYIKNVHGPLPQVEMMPSGGVSIDNMHEWYQQGAFAVGIGSALTKNANDNINQVKINTQQFVQKLKDVRG
ncbi:bifunctional 2-keto-4-hydroxyglutarate aldolase/2-keto-3-deoxy-6-phosphogluconate aldolase [Staphylococcus caledonicus]|uniref:bifunctional 2-keto-4-hydroxyglutarate aldolase/2-keto-3-deoxy-6-phosphogluconate aldolase n=1 Tax=Staphylococcus caledonicus TaxID=2741333 RepID=UPI000D1C71C6|nr:bifunctional 2-keto-4-hydroxyglutarate aldolase/2-keto-3-deoxy-6-phosphogluconate aldolase [Staphylococcus caledonicus]MBI5973142.1 bifunctional 2-keto-4-hydroxyglutarate aldolase/2-keto-3-deoxy-6-phosphogluconate aldolase [Staphylococcus caledonicus]PTE68378.1 2-dehydro-3-deoxyphosphogluconate aldolase [Staphylococcus devriesei]